MRMRRKQIVTLAQHFIDLFGSRYVSPHTACADRRFGSGQQLTPCDFLLSHLLFTMYIYIFLITLACSRAVVTLPPRLEQADGAAELLPWRTFARHDRSSAATAASSALHAARCLKIEREELEKRV